MWLIIVLIVLACILLLAALLLLIPVGLAFELDIHGQPRLSASFTWMFGLVRLPIKPKVRKKKAAGKKAKPRKKRSRLKIWSMLRSRGLVRQFGRLARRVLGCINFRDFELRLRFGLGSPADTGIMFGMMQPALLLIPASCSVSIEPDFSGAVVEGQARGRITFVPACILAAFLAFIFSAASMRLLGGLVTGKWKKKK